MAKQRPRFSPRGSYVKTYTPKKTVNYENLVKLSFVEQIKAYEPLCNPIEASIYAYFKIPQSVSKKKREAMLNLEELPKKKPDCDNIAKIILDALNGIAYDDDKQVVNLHVYKRYSDTPHVEVDLREI